MTYVYVKAVVEIGQILEPVLTRVFDLRLISIPNHTSMRVAIYMTIENDAFSSFLVDFVVKEFDLRRIYIKAFS